MLQLILRKLYFSHLKLLNYFHIIEFNEVIEEIEHFTEHVKQQLLK